jgi:hypothetical protein
MLQTTERTAALGCLLERALEKRKIMPQVSDWLSSPQLHARLDYLLTSVITQHSTLPSAELEQGWRVLCLVLSANDDNGRAEMEQVFPPANLGSITCFYPLELDFDCETD